MQSSKPIYYGTVRYKPLNGEVMVDHYYRLSKNGKVHCICINDSHNIEGKHSIEYASYDELSQAEIEYLESKMSIFVEHYAEMCLKHHKHYFTNVAGTPNGRYFVFKGTRIHFPWPPEFKKDNV